MKKISLLALLIASTLLLTNLAFAACAAKTAAPSDQKAVCSCCTCGCCT